MRVVVDSGGQDGGDTATPGTVVAISIDTDNATVADLAAAVNLPEAALVIDGIVHLSEVPLADVNLIEGSRICLLYTSPSPRDRTRSRMPSSA